ncbi:MAG: exonuclease SbcC [Candidatus Azotimanducaceae bacterium]|jgi:exonuclease SbcC
MKIGRSPKWQHDDPDVRLKALSDPDLEQTHILTLANLDPETRVRIAAIERLQDRSALLLLCGNAGPAEIQQAAASRIAALYSSDGQIPTNDLPTNVLMALARSADGQDLRVASVKRIQQDQSLLELLQGDNVSRVWQQCALQLQDLTFLESIHKDFLSKDKGVLQIIRDRLHTRDVAAQTATQQLEQAQLVAQGLLALGQNQADASQLQRTEHRRFNLLFDQWQMLLATGLPATIAADLEQQVQAVIDKWQTDIAAAKDRAQTAGIAAQQIVTELETKHVELSTTTDHLDGFSGLSELATTLKHARESWPIGLEAADELITRYDTAVSTLSELAQQLTLVHALIAIDDSASLQQLSTAASKIQWPEAYPEPGALAVKRQTVTDRQASERQHSDHLNKDLAALDQQHKELDEHIQAGQLKPAMRAHQSAAKKLERLKTLAAGSSILNPRNELQQQFAAKLQELKDWQGFATNPKRIELCETMEQLSDETSIPPDEKAQAIKEMQQQWKALGSSDSKEGQKLWSRFKLASDKAYEPCGVFFEEQKKTRLANLKNRQDICDSLELFEKDNHWDTADWKGVNDIITKAQRQWQDYSDIPRNKFKKLQQRFTIIIKLLRDRLGAEQASNHESKRQLINEIINQIEAQAPVATLVELTKQSQRAWQNVGVCDRRVDQKLWKQFRAQCDSVFVLRDAAAKEIKQVVNSHRQQAQDLCQQLRQSIQDDTVGKLQIQQCQQTFRQIELDRSDARVRKDFDGLCKQAQQAIKARGNIALKTALLELKRRALLCLKLEMSEATREAVMSDWESDIELPTDWAERIQQRRDQDAALIQAQAPDNLETAQALCVRIELLAGLDSPPEAQQRRMQYQVERLKRELSQGIKETRTPDEQLREIQIAWYCLGALSSGSENLFTRFQHAEAKLGIV